MFGDMMEKMQKQQEEMKEKLASMKVQGSSGDGAITVEANGNSEILNINIDESKIDLSDKEELADLIIVAVNRTIEMAKTQEEMEAQKSIGSILPGGMGGLGSLFGG